jgi:hypothetical protein
MEYGEEFGPLIDRLAGLDPYFISLAELKEKLVDIFNGFFLEGVVNERAA